MCVCVSVNKCSHKLSREVCLHRFGRDPNQMVRLCVLCRVPIRRLCTCVSTDEVLLSLWLLHSLFGLKMQPFERGISRRSRWANSLSLWRTSNDRFTPVSSLFFQSAAPWLRGFMYVCVLSCRGERSTTHNHKALRQNRPLPTLVLTLEQYRGL